VLDGDGNGNGDGETAEVKQWQLLALPSVRDSSSRLLSRMCFFLSALTDSFQDPTRGEEVTRCELYNDRNKHLRHVHQDRAMHPKVHRRIGKHNWHDAVIDLYPMQTYTYIMYAYAGRH
jgi:hypothetical protein